MIYNDYLDCDNCGKKVYCKADVCKHCKVAFYDVRTIEGNIGLLRDHEQGFSADAYMGKYKDDDQGKKDCELASEICGEVANNLAKTELLNRSKIELLEAIDKLRIKLWNESPQGSSFDFGHRAGQSAALWKLIELIKNDEL